MVLGRLVKAYLFLGLASVALIPLTVTGQSVPTDDQSTATTQPTPHGAPKKWQKKKKKKPTILQSWKKVVTGDWASLNKYDNRNLTLSAVTLGAVYTFYYYCLRSAPVVNQQGNGQRNQQQQRRENPENIPGYEPTPAQQAVIDLETRINNVPKNPLPCIGQAGLTCGNHAFINTKWALEQLEQFPDTTPQALGAILTHNTMPNFIQHEIAEHDKITNERREPELWKAYIRQQVTNSLARKQSTWQWLTTLFGANHGFSQAELQARDNIATLLHDITYTKKQVINFCTAGSPTPTHISIKTTISNLIDTTNVIKGIDVIGASKEEKAANTAQAKEACKNLLDHINLNAWQRNMGTQLQATPEMLNTAKRTMPRGRDLDSTEIGSLIGREKVNADALYKTERKKDEHGNLLPDELDDQIIKWIGDKTAINGKIVIVQDSIQPLLTGSTSFYDIQAVKQVCHEQANCTIGFALRLNARVRDNYEALKTITPETREAILRPIVLQNAETSSSHWISVVLHRINGQNHYYVTDSMDIGGWIDPNARFDVRMLIEAIETNNSY
jgi:uncharacterized protein YlzI (FlbEa/FlbD family)